MPFEDAKIIEFLKHYAPIAAARLDEASLWSQSLLFMANICLLGKSEAYLSPACAKDMLE